MSNTARIRGRELDTRKLITNDLSVENGKDFESRLVLEEKIDRDLIDSFPASDPPGWTLGVERRH